jgi:hypothetical protein
MSGYAWNEGLVAPFLLTRAADVVQRRRLVLVFRKGRWCSPTAYPLCVVDVAFGTLFRMFVEVNDHERRHANRCERSGDEADY